MTRSENMEHVEVLREIEARFVSGNSIPVERVHITRAEFDAIASLTAPAEAQAVANGVVQRHVVTKFSDGSTRVEDVLTAPSAPVGVEGLVAKWERVAADDAYRASTLRVCIKQLRALAQQPAAAGPVWMGIDWAEGQQPAADGGFTAADMMDARQEGRKEAQQPAADSPSFTAGDMADAAAQGFRDGVASVGETVGVEGLIAEWKMLIAHPDTSTIMRATLENVVIRLQHTLAQQPAADGGFTAADMMDARQEGRKEAQQAAGFSAGDMADASAQGFRAGAESVQQPADVDEIEGLKRLVRHLAGNPNFDFEAALAAQQGGRSDD